jgi:flagellar biogenesis protein FliO
MLIDYARFFFALAAVIGLIWLVGYGLKRFGIDKRLRGATGNHGRLAVLDVLYLDPKRKLTLVRADAKEYLLLITAEQAMVIDQISGKATEAKHDA